MIEDFAMSDPYIIADLIQRAAGYVVEMRDLCVCRMKNGKYQIINYVAGEPQTQEFDSPWAAANEFCRKRKEMGFGFDVEPPPPEAHVG